ncbi:hypothetical protein LVB87_11105 [Lysobacter sp. KIS68-7]|uniref:hypothetical protein n=1 Tax=Lysobacter sp. KIS68-7 TaxID=2904252 RepID=UPI001E52C885|nr:hypothetical protein [Lysobacter sp. KIS68-7]UHQ18733.1 hypothetical protein LVB87_11105 [Lysobacter sp. KIS68-7]
MGVRSIIRLFLFLIVLAIAGGYATAFFSRSACIDDAWGDLAPRGIRGHALGGTDRPLAKSDLEARVVGPFRVEVSYLVLDGLQSTVYARRYEALPWKRQKLSEEAHRIEAL